MSIHVRPATVFEDVATMVGPKRPDANVCWCLSYRIPSKENQQLSGPARGERVAALIAQGPPGVLAYDGDEVVGWAAVHPRADTTFATNRRIPHVDDLPVWSIWCIRVRPGHREQGISHHLLDGAVEYARSQGAPAVGGVSGRQPRREGRSHHGLRRDPGAVLGGRLRVRGGHHVGAERLPAGVDAQAADLMPVRRVMGGTPHALTRSAPVPAPAG